MSVMTQLQVLVGRSWASNAASARVKYRLTCPRYTHPNLLAEVATQDAVTLTSLVRDEDPEVVFGALQYYTHQQLSVLCVALAAMVPTDRSPADLLGWLDSLSNSEAA